MDRKKRVLVVTPSFHFPPTGAEQKDRASGFMQFLRLGYEVKVIAKLSEWRSAEAAAEVARGLGIQLVTVPYKYSNKDIGKWEIVHNWLIRISRPLFLDGAAFEYAEPEIKKVLEREVKEWRPDFV